MVFRSFKMLFLVSAYLFIFNVHIMGLVLQNDTIRYSGNIYDTCEMSEVINKIRMPNISWLWSINIHSFKSECIKIRSEYTKCRCIDNVASTFTDNGIIIKDFMYQY